MKTEHETEDGSLSQNGTQKLNNCFLRGWILRSRRGDFFLTSEVAYDIMNLDRVQKNGTENRPLFRQYLHMIGDENEAEDF